EGVRVGSGADGGCTRSTVGKGSGSEWSTEERRWQGPKASDVGGCAEEDRCCTKGTMGEAEGGKKEGLASFTRRCNRPNPTIAADIERAPIDLLEVELSIFRSLASGMLRRVACRHWAIRHSETHRQK